MLREMTVKVLTVDPLTNMPIVILKDQADEVSLPIWVGSAEANSIGLELEKIKFPRPLTHDLLRNVLDRLDVKVERVVITDLKENTYFAEIVLLAGQESVVLDSRPSDAIALALRADAPIFVDEGVLARGKTSDSTVNWEIDQKKTKEWLETLSPEDFSKYEM